LAEAVLPVRRTRCISRIAVDGFTANRAAAWRALLPAATDRTIRSRRSRDRGAAIATFTTLDLTSPNTTPDATQPQIALGLVEYHRELMTAEQR
jgi:hypothetical protein